MITFIYYDTEGEKHEVECLTMPLLKANRYLLQTEAGEILVYTNEITTHKTVFDI